MEKEIKSVQEILENKHLFINSGWRVEEHDSCLLMYQLDVNKESGAFFVSRSMRIEPDFKLIGFLGGSRFFQIKNEKVNLRNIEKSLHLLRLNEKPVKIEPVEPKNVVKVERVLDCIPDVTNVRDLFIEPEVNDVIIPSMEPAHLNDVEDQFIDPDWVPKVQTLRKVRSKPYSCTLCPKTFSTFCQVMKHQEIHAEGKPTVSCLICGKSYKRPGCLKNHMHTFHRYNDQNEFYPVTAHVNQQRPFKMIARRQTTIE